MNGTMKCLIVLLTAFALIAVPCGAGFAASMQPDREVAAGQMIGDALVARPLGLCATIIGSVVFVVSLPFSASGGNVKPVFDRLMADPALFTFNRPLGQF